MKAGDAIEIVNALRECAASLELELQTPYGLDEQSDVALSDTLRGALLELGAGLSGLGTLALELGERELAILAALGGQKPPAEVVRFLVASICDGVRRPGSWERGCVVQLFGHDRTIDAEAEMEDTFKGPPYREVD